MKRAAFAVAAQYVSSLSIKQVDGGCGKNFFADGCGVWWSAVYGFLLPYYIGMKGCLAGV